MAQKQIYEAHKKIGYIPIELQIDKQPDRHHQTDKKAKRHKDRQSHTNIQIDRHNRYLEKKADRQTFS